MSKLSKLIEQFLSNPAEARFEEVQYVLEGFGFEEKRSKGSHHTFENALGQVLTIPKKGGQKVKRIYLKKIVELLNLEEWQGRTENENQQESHEE